MRLRLLEDLAHLGIDDQVEIALAVAGFDVGQPVPLLRQRQQRLGQQPQRVGAQREFAGLGAKGRAGDRRRCRRYRAYGKSSKAASPS